MKPMFILAILLLGSILVQPAKANHQFMVTSVSEESRTGPDATLLKAVAREITADINFRYAPFKRRLIMLENGDVDMVCGMLKRPEREAYIHFVSPPYKTRSDTIFFVPKGNAGRISSYEDLKGLKIGVVRGAKFFVRFDQDTTLNKEIASHAISNFNKLLLGRLDTVILNESQGIDLLSKMDTAPKIDMAAFRFSREKHVFFGISKKSWMMKSLDRIEATLEKMIRSGKVKKILETYYRDRGLPVPAM